MKREEVQIDGRTFRVTPDELDALRWMSDVLGPGRVGSLADSVGILLDAAAARFAISVEDAALDMGVHMFYSRYGPSMGEAGYLGWRSILRCALDARRVPATEGGPC
ncbi:MAG: hypothetical protein ACYC61_17815 [Isosphaeraceae bacterium]